MSMYSGESIREQLSKLQFRPQRQFASVQPVSQILLSLPSESPHETFAQARREILTWLANRAGRPIPKAAWAGESFELDDVGSQRTAAVALDTPNYWAARIDDADKSVPRRTWTTEIGIGISATNEVLFGCRLYCVALGDAPAFEPSIPGVVRQVAQRLPAMLDGRRVDRVAWRIQNNESVRQLVDLLCSPSRRRPVLVLSSPNNEAVLIAPDLLAEDLTGAAHVVEISSDATFALKSILGKEFSVFGGAIRTYRQQFNPDTDQPSDHPLALPSSIRAWIGGTDGFRQFLISQALRESVSQRQELEKDLPSFSHVQAYAQRLKRERAKAAGQTDSELLQMALEENESLTRDHDETRRTYEGLLEGMELDRLRALEERDQAKAELRNVRARVDHLEQALSVRGVQEKIDLPVSLDNLEEWATRHLAGSVLILNRAYRAAKKSDFNNPPLVYKTLLILKDLYVPMKRLGGLERKVAYEEALSKLGLVDTPSFSGARAGEQGEEYFVRFGERRRELDHHIKGSNARDGRHGFRVYFFWDEDGEQVVIGWLPSHLPNRAT